MFTIILLIYSKLYLYSSLALITLHFFKNEEKTYAYFNFINLFKIVSYSFLSTGSARRQSLNFKLMSNI